ncbi:protein mono-ADP-ribosyltransferase PARP14-like isoform X2 [Saccostrea echinata]|uniref:protein mono-ADP-ribosyltransferase PARP14-like isoform X2 n=1 Tax=Saccostrea echinata TaxID=191078 RepID=UPI002A82B0FF|nr:protein mono-ADP-ribosyltransferase PARP14-like isoform X2 [Saccostrea echinata]
MASAVGIRREFNLKWNKDTIIFKIYRGSITKPSGPVEAIVSIWDRGKAEGFSEAIIKEAGNEVVEEIRANRQIKNNENLVTKAGRLPCKFIIHCACPRWENYDMGSKAECLKDLCETITKALLTACERGVKSIALPPIGSGKIFGIPNIASAAMYVKSVMEYRNFLLGKNSIKEIHFIDKKDDMIELVIDTYEIALLNSGYLEEKSVMMRLNDQEKHLGQIRYPNKSSNTYPSNCVPGQQQCPNPYNSIPSTVPMPQPDFKQFQYPLQSNPYTPSIANIRHINSSGGTEIFELNNLNVLIYTEDLTKIHNIDILVSTENAQVPGNGKLAKAILEKAGNSYQKEHTKLFSGKKKRNTTEVLQTSAGCLSFKLVLHAIIEKFPDDLPSDFYLQQLWDTTLNILNAANTKKVKRKKLLSIALSLLGTGSIQDPQHLARYATVMLQAIESFSSAKNVNLKAIHIVNFTEQTTEVVVDVFRSFCSNSNRQRDRQVIKKKETKSEIKKIFYKDSHKFNPKNYKRIDSWRSSANHEQNVELFLVSVPPRSTCLGEFNNSTPVQKRGSKSGTGNLLMIDSDSEDSDTEISDTRLDSELTEKDACADVADENETLCVICMDDELTDPVLLKDCKHEFCRECITEYLYHKSACPVCNTVYGEMYGNQPENGTATVYLDDACLPGYSCKTLIIHYEFPDGNQMENHPSPGEPYHGLSRQGYLPDNKEGRLILRMLKRAFEHRLIFTVGFSRTSGKDNVVTWNDIHHKTRREGGPEKYGYPDPDYLSRVKDELNDKGISEE